jgi:hypothetical protein
MRYKALIEFDPDEHMWTWWCTCDGCYDSFSAWDTFENAIDDLRRHVLEHHSPLPESIDVDSQSPVEAVDLF